MGNLPLVKVTWIDAWLDSDGEVSLSDVHDNLKECVDTGILIKKTRKAIVLACSYEDEDQVVRFITRIPWKLVLKIEESIGFKTTFEKNGEKHEQARSSSTRKPNSNE